MTKIRKILYTSRKIHPSFKTWRDAAPDTKSAENPTNETALKKVGGVDFVKFVDLSGLLQWMNIHAFLHSPIILKRW